MIKIVVQGEIAEQIRQSEGQVELVDNQGQRVGIVRRSPTQQEIELARSRIGTEGPKVTVEELINKIESL
ncbi:MAG: hypothetical protein EA381_07680 [Planctomycetaceae bacterium]|nr:MAG: hypothetical protein EA381_07680 [Planctomycetaceae bacterium]